MPVDLLDQRVDGVMVAAEDGVLLAIEHGDAGDALARRARSSATWTTDDRPLQAADDHAGAVGDEHQLVGVGIVHIAAKAGDDRCTEGTQLSR